MKLLELCRFDPHHHPHVDVITVNFHTCPIAHKQGWTVRNAGPAVAENFDIVPAVPAGPELSGRIACPRIVHPASRRRPAIAFDHNIELEHRCLRGSSKQSHVWRLRRGFSTRCQASPCRSSTARHCIEPARQMVPHCSITSSAWANACSPFEMSSSNLVLVNVVPIPT